MAREATARLYDVDEDAVIFKKLNQTKKYDQGLVIFKARKGKLVDLDKLHESVWASRLAHGTRSGLVSLDVVTIGTLVETQDGFRLAVSGSDSEFVLTTSPDPKHSPAFKSLKALAKSESLVRLNGRIDNYQGRWPSLYKQPLKKPRQLMVHQVEPITKEGAE